MSKIEIARKAFLFSIFGALTIGVIMGVLVSFPGWTRYGIQMERDRPKTAVELIDSLRELEMRLEEQLGAEKFRGKTHSVDPPQKTIEL